jgi:hypothetical protein
MVLYLNRKEPMVMEPQKKEALVLEH